MAGSFTHLIPGTITPKNRLRDRVGTMEALLDRLDTAPASSGTLGRGRAGVRVAQLARIAGLLGGRGLLAG